MEIDTGKMNRLVELMKTNPDLLQQVRSASDSQAALTILADASLKNGIDIDVAELTALVKQAGTPTQGVLTVEQLDLINAGSDVEEYFKSFADALAGTFGMASNTTLALLETATYATRIATDANSKS